MDSAPVKIAAYKDPKLPPAPVASTGLDWAEVLVAISAADAETLVMAVRTLYPHDGLATIIYRRVVMQFDRLAAAVPNAAAAFVAFCKSAGTIGALPFAAGSESYRIQALRRIETTPEFMFVQRTAMRYLYDDVEVWAAFGYEGASVHRGGYVGRGFDDLSWLPDLPNDL